jgi:hypothetical protein
MLAQAGAGAQALRMVVDNDEGMDAGMDDEARARAKAEAQAKRKATRAALHVDTNRKQPQRLLGNIGMFPLKVMEEENKRKRISTAVCALWRDFVLRPACVPCDYVYIWHVCACSVYII